MTPLLVVITFSGLFIYLAVGHNPNSIARKPYGCATNFYSGLCYKRCPNSTYWCYTRNYPAFIGRDCMKGNECKFFAKQFGKDAKDMPCDGWCAWNSPKGCVRYCEGDQPEFHCGEGYKYWECRLDHGDGYQSAMAIEGKWLTRYSRNEIILHNNTIRRIRDDPSELQTAIWAPTGPIQNSTDEFFWTFYIREKPESSNIYVGVSLSIDYEYTYFYGGPKHRVGNSINGEYVRNLEVGDLILMYVKCVKEKMTFYFGLNDDPIFKEWEFIVNEPIYPFVRFRGRGVVEINETTRDVLNGKIWAVLDKKDLHEV